jgi:hypothetical protein
MELRNQAWPSDHNTYNSVIRSQINMKTGPLHPAGNKPSLFVGFAGIVLKNHMD